MAIGYTTTGDINDLKEALLLYEVPHGAQKNMNLENFYCHLEYPNLLVLSIYQE
uniref:Uncharacterized protein n=1 Tax=Arundo donax TaxID=35708 RepID=A0A0A8YRS2_ARUDO